MTKFINTLESQFDHQNSKIICETFWSQIHRYTPRSAYKKLEYFFIFYVQVIYALSITPFPFSNQEIPLKLVSLFNL